MARAVKPALAAGALFMLALAGPPLGAQSLFDPTQPPASLNTPLVSGQVAPPVAPAGPELQSLLISRNPGGRKIAVIDGQTLRVGSRLGDAVLVRMTETEVVLKRGKAYETLKLFPRSEPGATIKGKN
ncbi:MSHA biogenesis protein MshK [Oxalobacteraceae bacterium GrIS 1.11]